MGNEERLHQLQKEAVDNLLQRIRKAKAKAWDDLLDTIDGDPWGRPYRLVLGKLITKGPPTTEQLDPQFLEQVIHTLFPATPGSHQESSPLPLDAPPLSVTNGEMRAVTRKMEGENTVSGPDGVPGRALALVLRVLGDRLRNLFDGCLVAGRFPERWKVAKLTLIPKSGRAPDSLSAFRPICLLDESGKLFERIVAIRLAEHLTQEGPDLSENQYRFQRERSTIDATERVKLNAQAALNQGGKILAVSIDIV